MTENLGTGMKTARKMETAHRESVEEGQIMKRIRRIIKITAKIPIIRKAIAVTVDSIRIARRNLKAN